jgi:hypothetical protein
MAVLPQTCPARSSGWSPSSQLSPVVAVLRRFFLGGLYRFVVFRGTLRARSIPIYELLIASNPIYEIIKKFDL